MSLMKRIASAAALGGTIMLGSGLISLPAQAGYVVTLAEQGGDVVASGSGAIDLTGLSLDGNYPIYRYAHVAPFSGDIGIGPPGDPTLAVYSGVSGPSNFGFGIGAAASSGTGDTVLMVSSNGPAFPLFYAGSILSNTSTYTNTSLTTLGAKTGTYEWTWGTGPNQNFTLIVGSSPGPIPAPEPASAAMLGMALAGLLLAGKTRRRQPEA